MLMFVICLKKSLALGITSWPYLNWKMWSTKFGIIYQGECIQQHSSLSHTKPIMRIVCWTCHSYCCHITRSENFDHLHVCLIVLCLPPTIACTFLIGVSLSKPHTMRLYCECAYVYCAYVCMIVCGHILNSKLYYVLQTISTCLHSQLLIEKTAWLANL